MYEDFRNKSYKNTSNKLRTEWEITRRLIADADDKMKRVNNILSQLKQMHLILPYTESHVETTVFPDLIIESISHVIYTNYVDFTIVIKNQGDEASEACSLSIDVGTKDLHGIAVTALEPDATDTIYYTFYFDSTAPAHDYILTAEVDETEIIDESDETNNIKTDSFTAKDEYAIPSGQGGLILHCHNPEGKELGSFGYAPSANYGTVCTGSADHNVPTYYVAGTYNVVVTFNGMTSSQSVTLTDGNITSCTAMFTRSEVDVTTGITASVSRSGSIADQAHTNGGFGLSFVWSFTDAGHVYGDCLPTGDYSGTIYGYSSGSFSGTCTVSYPSFTGSLLMSATCRNAEDPGDPPRDSNFYGTIGGQVATTGGTSSIALPSGSFNTYYLQKYSTSSYTTDGTYGISCIIQGIQLLNLGYASTTVSPGLLSRSCSMWISGSGSSVGKSGNATNSKSITSSTVVKCSTVPYDLQGIGV